MELLGMRRCGFKTPGSDFRAKRVALQRACELRGFGLRSHMEGPQTLSRNDERKRCAADSYASQCFIE